MQLAGILAPVRLRVGYEGRVFEGDLFGVGDPWDARTMRLYPPIVLICSLCLLCRDEEKTSYHRPVL